MPTMATAADRLTAADRCGQRVARPAETKQPEDYGEGRNEGIERPVGQSPLPQRGSPGQPEANESLAGPSPPLQANAPSTTHHQHKPQPAAQAPCSTAPARPLTIPAKRPAVERLGSSCAPSSQFVVYRLEPAHQRGHHLLVAITTSPAGGHLPRPALIGSSGRAAGGACPGDALRPAAPVRRGRQPRAAHPVGIVDLRRAATCPSGPQRDPQHSCQAGPARRRRPACRRCRHRSADLSAAAAASRSVRTAALSRCPRWWGPAIDPYANQRGIAPAGPGAHPPRARHTCGCGGRRRATTGAVCVHYSNVDWPLPHPKTVTVTVRPRPSRASSSTCATTAQDSP